MREMTERTGYNLILVFNSSWAGDFVKAVTIYQILDLPLGPHQA